MNYKIIGALFAIFVLTLSGVSAMSADLDVLTKNNRNGKVELILEIQHEGDFDHANIKFNYRRVSSLSALNVIGKRNYLASDSFVPFDQIDCNLESDGDFKCLRRNRMEEKGQDISEQFDVELKTWVGSPTCLSSKPIGVVSSASKLHCSKKSIHKYYVKWKTPNDLYLGRYDIIAKTVEDNGENHFDTGRFRSVKIKGPTLSSQEPPILTDGEQNGVYDVNNALELDSGENEDGDGLRDDDSGSENPPGPVPENTLSDGSELDQPELSDGGGLIGCESNNCYYGYTEDGEAIGNVMNGGNDNEGFTHDDDAPQMNLRDLIYCVYILGDMREGMMNNDGVANEHSLGNLNGDEWYSLADLVVFQQNFKTAGWCRNVWEDYNSAELSSA